MPTIEVSDQFIAQQWLRDNNLIAIDGSLLGRVNALAGVMLDPENLILRSAANLPQPLKKNLNPL